MVRSRETSLGGGREEFPTTHWTALGGGRDPTEAGKQAAIEALMQNYWRPVYAWLRKKGHSIEAAKDLTQGFFCDIVLDRDLAGRADRTKGRFRTFLLNALANYVSDERRHREAQIRSPRGSLVCLEAAQETPASLAGASPEDAFNREWAGAILDGVIRGLRAEYEGSGKATHWAVFRDKTLEPILTGVPSPPYEDLCRKYGIADEHKAAAMVTTVKRRFRSFLRVAVRPHVESDADVDDEISELLRCFSRSSA